MTQAEDHEAGIAQIIAPYTPSGWSNETRMADARKCAKDVLAYLSRYPPPERGPQLVCNECSRAFWTERDAAGHLTYTGNGPGGYSPCTGTVSCVAPSPQGEHDRVLVNDEKTALVNIWSTGEVEVAFRADPGAVWGPPVRVVEDA